MNGGPSGFHNAPITRIIIIACTVFTVVAGTRGRSATLGVSYQDIFRKLQVGTLISSLFSFSSTLELMFGVFVFFSLIMTTLFEIISLGLLKGHTFNPLAPGPYALIFSSFLPFYFDIPVSTQFCISGLIFSDKSFIYLAGLQLLLSSWKRTILPGICGILAGLLYRLNLFHICTIKVIFLILISQSVAVQCLYGVVHGTYLLINLWILQCCCIIVFTLILALCHGRTSSRVPRRNTTRNAPPIVHHGEVNNYAPSAPFASMLEPAEDSIATLVSMGFDRSSARQALVQARNDLTAVTNILLERNHIRRSIPIHDNGEVEGHGFLQGSEEPVHQISNCWPRDMPCACVKKRGGKSVT